MPRFARNPPGRSHVTAYMPAEPFEPKDESEVRRIHADTYAGMRLDRFLWQPCQQVESLEIECSTKLVYREGASVVGYAAGYALDATHYRLNLLVDRRRAGRGVGTSLLKELEAGVRWAGGEYLQARLLEGTPSGLDFALARGFEEVHRMRGMTLRARDFSYEEWQPLRRRLSAEGFSLTTLEDEERATPDALDRLAELHAGAQEGWPSPDPTWRAEDAGLWRSIFGGAASPQLFSIMKLGDRYVGYTSAWRDNAVGTAVHPEFRGRGVATYMKAHNLGLCVGAGGDYFESSSANPSMIRVNLKLGYALNGLAEIRLLRRL